MNNPDVAGARQFAFNMLERTLPRQLCYHSLQHTFEDVVPAVERLARHEGVVGSQLMLVRTAAYFHDLGYVGRREHHEQISVDIATTVLPLYGYAAAQIEQIANMILATRMPQQPHTLLEQVLADADLDSLGRVDFSQKSALLRKELAAYEGHLSDQAWYEWQLAFLRKHHYWTKTAQTLRNQGKHTNIVRITHLIKDAHYVYAARAA
ncbi:MAG: HD domain-containing protein [Roseiflexaceae bacterium]|nr:HD domain-containing protein [Roseiflexaceae bacterium]